MSVFGVIMVRIFPHSYWIRRDIAYLSVFGQNAGKYGPEKLPIRTYFTQWVPLTLTVPLLSLGHEIKHCYFHELWFANCNTCALNFLIIKVWKWTVETRPKRSWNFDLILLRFFNCVSLVIKRSKNVTHIVKFLKNFLNINPFLKPTKMR